MLKYISLILALTFAAPAAAEFILPQGGGLFMVGTTAEIQAFRQFMIDEQAPSSHFLEACNVALWPEGPWCMPVDCAWELGDGSVDCATTTGYYYDDPEIAATFATLDIREQNDLPQICLDRLALQFCGYNPEVDWPWSCGFDGYCCQD